MPYSPLGSPSAFSVLMPQFFRFRTIEAQDAHRGCSLASSCRGLAGRPGLIHVPAVCCDVGSATRSARCGLPERRIRALELELRDARQEVEVLSNKAARTATAREVRFAPCRPTVRAGALNPLLRILISLPATPPVQPMLRCCRTCGPRLAWMHNRAAQNINSQASMCVSWCSAVSRGRL